MGGHSAPDRWPFYRSIAGWFLPWLLIAAVVGTAVWFAVDAVSDGELEEPASSTVSDQASAKPSPTRTASPTPSRTPRATPTADATPGLITEGISVQVLNGTMVLGAHERVAEELSGLGFQIAALEEASESYELTTVFWSDQAFAQAAEALAARFGWEVAEKPANLSDQVSIHVVVGLDEAG